MPVGLIALALGGFGIGLTEFVIMGLLPQVAADFSVTEATAGWLISGYALAVVVGALGLTAAVTRFERKPVLAVLMVLFIAGNLVSAVAPDYALMMAGRIIAALSHGAFFGIGAVVAASMVEPTKKAGAIAIMFTGLTAANVLGVPFGTMLGQAAGWRSTFWAITVIGVLALAGILALVPNGRPRRRPPRLLWRIAWRTPCVPVGPGLALHPRHHPRLRRHVRRLHLHCVHAHRGHRLLRRHGPVVADPLRRRAVHRQQRRRQSGRQERGPHPAGGARRVGRGARGLRPDRGQPADDHRLHGAAGRLRLRHGARPPDARDEVRQPAPPPWPPARTSAPSTSATPLGPGWAASPSPPVSATRRRSGPAPGSPCWAWR